MLIPELIKKTSIIYFVCSSMFKLNKFISSVKVMTIKVHGVATVCSKGDDNNKVQIYTQNQIMEMFK